MDGLNEMLVPVRIDRYNGMLVPVRTSFGLRRRGGKTYQRKVNVDMLNAVKSALVLRQSKEALPARIGVDLHRRHQ